VTSAVAAEAAWDQYQSALAQVEGWRCLANNEWLREDELIAAAIDNALSRPTHLMNAPDEPWLGSHTPVMFWIANPDCGFLLYEFVTQPDGRVRSVEPQEKIHELIPREAVRRCDRCEAEVEPLDNLVVVAVDSAPSVKLLVVCEGCTVAAGAVVGAAKMIVPYGWANPYAD